MNKINDTYMLCANAHAMALFKQSKETLMTSASYDFIVFRFTHWEEVQKELEEWEDYVAIDEPTYHDLYTNLCVKFRELIQYL